MEDDLPRTGTNNKSIFFAGPDRRDVLLGSLAAATGASLASGAAEAATKPERMAAVAGDRIQIIKGPHKDKFLRPDMLEIGAKPFEAFPYDPQAQVLRDKNRLNRLLVLRLDPNRMDEETRDTSANGTLVYSAICTHRGCTIKSWKAEEQILRCHCHLSEFAPLSGGSVMDGPAKRQLPRIPLGVDDEGYVVAMDTFTRKPGGAKK